MHLQVFRVLQALLPMASLVFEKMARLAFSCLAVLGSACGPVFSSIPFHPPARSEASHESDEIDAMKSPAMKAAMKKKRVSKVTRGKAKVAVFKGNKEKTASGHAKADPVVSKTGKVVSKKSHAAGKKAYKNIAEWTKACHAARTELGIKGLCTVNGKTAQGKAFYAKAKAIFAFV